MRGAALALLLVSALAVRAKAQAPNTTSVEAADTAQDRPAAPARAVDPTRLGVSLNRIQRGLRLSESRERSSGTPLKLEYQVQVFGAAPRLDIIKDFDIGQDAAIPYGAPTHAEFLQHWTPQAYRAPTAPIGALAGWALFQVVKRADKAKCEQEIADYRALVMQGIAAPAPRCTQ